MTAGPAGEVIKAAAVVVTFQPDEDVPGRLTATLAQVERLHIVDNGSLAQHRAHLLQVVELPGVTVQWNHGNVGVATALNQGIRVLAAEGYEWIFTVDQDTNVRPGCVDALLGRLETDHDPGTVGLLGSNRHNVGSAGSPHRWLRPRGRLARFERVGCDALDDRGTTAVITAGTLLNVRSFADVGTFRSDFFIDVVDFEYCLRLRAAGYRILVECDAWIDQPVGNRVQRSVLGLPIAATRHPPSRRYFLFRNSVVTMRLHGARFPHWACYQVLALLGALVAIVFVEDHRAEKLRACALGIVDGVRSSMGPARADLRDP